MLKAEGRGFGRRRKARARRVPGGWAGMAACVATVLALMPWSSRAAPDNPPEVTAVRVLGNIVIDGRLDESDWSRGQPAAGFIQTEPDEGKPASQQTEVIVLYDDDAIYFGARLHAEAPPTIRLSRRDYYVPADWFGVHLDPHHDHMTGASFYVSAAGVQRDSLRYNDVRGDSDWNAVWESAVTVNDQGWIVEMRIPFSQLRFRARDKKKDLVWGIDFTRSVNRLHEESGWVYIPLQESGFVSWFGHLVGLEGVEAPHVLELIPYGLIRGGVVSWDRDGNPLDPVNVPYVDDFSFGLDFRYGIGSATTMTGTINPDFGQVEVDPAVVNLSQYEVFYDEKRPFFLEGSDLFRFGESGASNNWNFDNWSPDVFYSRRIGRAPHLYGEDGAAFVSPVGQTPILGAIKLTGKGPGGLSFAMLNALTAPVWIDEVFEDGSESALLAEPLSNYAVGRVTQDLGGERGKVGGMVTSVYRDLPAEGDLRQLPRTATTGGVDGYLVLGDRKVVVDAYVDGSYVEGDAGAIEALQGSSARYYQRPDAEHVELDPEATALSGWMGRIAVNTEGGKFGVNAKVAAISPGYEVNDIGYLRRADVLYTHLVARYEQTDPGTTFRNWSAWMGKSQQWNFGGDLIDNGLSWNIAGRLLSYWGGWTGAGFQSPSWDDRLTRGGPLTRTPAWMYAYGGLYSDSRKPLHGFLGFNVAHSAQGGSSVGGFLSAKWQVNSALRLGLEPRLWYSEDTAQYVEELDTPPETDPPVSTDAGYVFSDLESWNMSLTTRVDWVLSPRLSLQVYVQPLVFAADYGTLKLLAAPGTYDFIPYSTQSDAYDFNFTSLRASAVLRWEFRPGSAFYAVWTSDRSHTENTERFRGPMDLAYLENALADDVFMVKMSYWWGT